MSDSVTPAVPSSPAVPAAPAVSASLAPAVPTAASRLIVRPGAPLTGECVVPGDKSISHRAVMLGGIATGTSRVRGFLHGADCHATIHALTALGCTIEFGPRRTSPSW